MANDAASDARTQPTWRSSAARVGEDKAARRRGAASGVQGRGERTPEGHKLPDLAADLNGQIRVLLHGKVDTGPGGGIRNTFEVVPDAPVTRFTLSLKGGRKGLIQNSEDLCAHPQRATALFDAQNGKTHDLEPALRAKCPQAKGHHKKRGRGR